MNYNVTKIIMIVFVLATAVFSFESWASPDRIKSCKEMKGKVVLNKYNHFDSCIVEQQVSRGTLFHVMAINYKIYSHGAKNYIIIFAAVSRPGPTVRRPVAATGRSDVRWGLADGWQTKLAQARILWYTRGSVTFTRL